MAINQTLAVILKAQDDTKGAFNSLNNNMNQLKNAAKALVGALAFKDVIDSTNQLGQQIDMLRDNLGISAQEASRLNYAARVMGTSAEEVSVSFGALNRNLINQLPLIQKGTSDFDKWGIATKNAKGEIVSFPELINNVRDRLRTLPPGLERSGAAMDLMGRSGRELLDLMTLSDKQFASLAQEAQDLGLIFNETGLDNMEDFRHNLNRLNLEFDALKLQLGQAIMPLLRNLVQWIRQNSGAFKAFGEVAGNLAGKVKVAADVMGNLWDKLKGLFGTVGANELAVDAFVLALAAMAAGPVGLAIAAVVLAFDEVSKTIDLVTRNWEGLRTAVHDGTLQNTGLVELFLIRLVQWGDFFSVFGATMNLLWANMKLVALLAINEIIKGLNHLPGVNIPLISIVSAQADVAAAEAALTILARDRTSLVTVITDESQRRGERSGGAAVGATEADIRNAYQTYLGRQPENEGAIIGRLGMDMATMIAGISNSQEAQNRNRVRGYATGGFVPNTGLAMLHAGETVIPAHGGSGSGITLNLTVSGNIAASARELAEMIADEVGTALVRATGMNRALSY